MNNKIKNILDKLCEKDGNEAYVVGGYVRDYLLGRETYDVDIATNLLPVDVINILGLNASNEDNYGSIRFKDSLYNYDITTFRREIKYENRKPVEFEYIKDCKEDSKRRDFTINALYMDRYGKIIDYYNGLEDLQDNIIRIIGDIDVKITEDPLRILRAIRLSAVLNFDIEGNLYNYIKQNTLLLRTLSYNRKKEELDLIFNSNNSIKGLKIIKELGLDKDLELEFDDVKECNDSIGIWAQINVLGDYTFNNKEQKNINDVKNILTYGIVDNMVLYQYGLYPSIIAGEILGISKSYISDLYKNLPIYSSKDINITGDEIMELLNIEPGEKIKAIINDIEINILNQTLVNDNNLIKSYILINWR